MYTYCIHLFSFNGDKIFKGLAVSSRAESEIPLLLAARQFRCTRQFHCAAAIKKKSNKTLPGSPPVVSCPRSVATCASQLGSGILSRFPFGGLNCVPILSNSRQAPSLGPTHPCPTAVHTEPFSTFSLQFVRVLPN